MSIDWQQYRNSILSSTNIAAEAEARGVRFAGEPGEDGWRPCFAVGREDEKPSAAINIRTGCYLDSGAGGKPINFFEFMGQWLGGWKAAQDHFAAKAGIPSPIKGSSPYKKDPKFDGKVWPSEEDAKLLIDSFPWPNVLIDWINSKPGIDPTALRDSQMITGFWPAKAPKTKRHRVIGVCFYDPDQPAIPNGYQLFRADGGSFPKLQKLAERKCHNVGGKNGFAYVGTLEQFQGATDYVLCEGPSDMLAVASHLPAGFSAVTLKCGAKSFPKSLAEIFTGKRVWICRDRDEAGAAGEVIAIENLLAVASELRLVRLPYPLERKKGKDARDFFYEGGTWEQFQSLAEVVDQAWEKPSETIKVEIDTDRERAVNEAIQALAEADRLRQRGGQLVHIVRDAKAPRGITREAGLPRIVPLLQPTLAEHLTSAADFVTIQEADGDEIITKIQPPEWLIKAVDARGEWPNIKPLVGIVETPIIRADGSILATPGYDNATGLLYSPQVEFPAVPTHPTLADAKAACELLLSVVIDFPFQADTHRAAWLAAAITPPARASIDGPVPLATIDANCPGSGKTLLADVIGMIYTGAKLPRTSAPPTDVEMAKTLLAIALAGDPMILFDNHPQAAFGCASLDAALTGSSFAGRILGASKMSGSVPLITQFFVTGNNLVLAADTARRALPIRIETQEENPEERQGFTHPNLLEWVAKERTNLAVAAVTILRAYHVAGCPKITNSKPWGSFEAWSDLIRNAVIWLGLPDPAGLREELRQTSDRTVSTLRQLIAGWEQMDPHRLGMTVSMMLRKLDASKDATTDPYPALREVVASLTKPGGEPSSQSIGQKIRHLQKRICGGKQFTKQEVDGVQLWKVEELGKDHYPGSKGNKGSRILTPMEENKTHFPKSENNMSNGAGDTTPRTPATPRQDCDHINPERWVRDEDGSKMLCPGCGKFLAMARNQFVSN